MRALDRDVVPFADCVVIFGNAETGVGGVITGGVLMGGMPGPIRMGGSGNTTVGGGSDGTTGVGNGISSCSVDDAILRRLRGTSFSGACWICSGPASLQ